MTATATTAPTLGQAWPEQGGIYIGLRLIDGQTHHVIMAGGTEADIVASHDNAAQRIAEKGEINGFSDWRHGSQEDVMLAYINAREHFPRSGIESVQVTSTPCGSSSAWVVDFEYGRVTICRRDYEFRVRPFRRALDRIRPAASAPTGQASADRQHRGEPVAGEYVTTHATSIRSAFEALKGYVSLDEEDDPAYYDHEIRALEAVLAAIKAPQPAEPVAKQSLADSEDAARYRWLRDRNDWYAEPRLDAEDGTVWRLTFYTPAPIIDPTDDDSLDVALIAAMLADAASTTAPHKPTTQQSLQVAEPVKVPSEAEVIEIIGQIMGQDRAATAVATKHSAAWVRFAHALLARYGAQPAVPDGWKLVPIKPTEDMVVAFAEEWYSHQQAIDDPQMDEAYAAMLDAVPAAPPVER